MGSACCGSSAVVQAVGEPKLGAEREVGKQTALVTAAAETGHKGGPSSKQLGADVAADSALAVEKGLAEKSETSELQPVVCCPGQPEAQQEGAVQEVRLEVPVKEAAPADLSVAAAATPQGKAAQVQRVVQPALSGKEDKTLPGLINYTFVPEESETFSFTPGGESAVLLDFTEPSYTRKAPEEYEHVKKMTLVCDSPGQGDNVFHCSEYSNSHFTVQAGTIQLPAGDALEAYSISPPAVKATQFMSTVQYIYLKVPAGKFGLYELSKDGLFVQVDFLESHASDETFLNTKLKVDSITEDLIFTYVPADRQLPLAKKAVLEAKEAKVDMEDFPAKYPLKSVFGDIVMVTVAHATEHFCYIDGRYNNDLYPAEIGLLKGTDGFSRHAYRISPPQHKATEFAAGDGQALYYRGPAGSEVEVRSFDGRVMGPPSAPVRLTEGLTPLGVYVTKLAAPTVFVITPAGERVSNWPSLSQQAEGAVVSQGDLFSLSARRYSIGCKPFDPQTDWTEAPGTHLCNYGTPKMFLSVAWADGRESLVFQDWADHSVHLAWLRQDLLGMETRKLLDTTDCLAGAVSDGKDELVLLLASTATVGVKEGVPLTMVKFGLKSSKEIKRQILEGFEMHKWDPHCSSASMVWNVPSGQIGFVLARVLLQSPDGLNHQSCAAVVVDASKLEIVVNHGQTSGHSLGNTLTMGSDGTFLGMDIGDNYPRGVHVWRFGPEKESIERRIVYQFKTEHGLQATSPAGVVYPAYEEISKPGVSFYKWSNDTNVYSEAGRQGVVEVSDGLLIFFLGEQPPLDSSQAGTGIVVPRDVGFVKIPKDLNEKSVLSPGPVETGGYYTFNGAWSEQKHEGIVFLTDLQGESASRLKVAPLGSGKILLLWEVWHPGVDKMRGSGAFEADHSGFYKRTQFMLVDEKGTPLCPVTELEYPLQMPIADDPVIQDGSVVVYAGTAEGKLIRWELKVTC